MLAKTSCSRVCVGSNLLFVWLWSNQLLEKKKKKKKKKKIENFLWALSSTRLHTSLLLLFHSFLFPCSGSGSCFCSCSGSCSCSCSGFLDLITSWDKTRLHCLYWVQLVLEELELENSWGKRQKSVRLLSKKKKKIAN